LSDVSEVRTASIIRALMEAVNASEMSANFNVNARRYIPEYYKPHFTFYLKHGSVETALWNS
jgi:hypothetical protein